MRYNQLAVIALASGASAQLPMAVISQIAGGVTKMLVDIGKARLDNSTDGKCHQLALFTNVMDSVQEPQIASILQEFEPAGAVLKVITSTISPFLEPLKADQQLVQSCQEIGTQARQTHDCVVRQVFTVINQPEMQQKIQSTPLGTRATELLKKTEDAFANRIQPIDQDQAKQQYCQQSSDLRCILNRIADQAVKLSGDKDQLKPKLFNSDMAVNFLSSRITMAKQKLDNSSTPELVQVCQKMPKILPVDIEAVTLDDVQFPNIPDMIKNSINLPDMLRASLGGSSRRVQASRAGAN